MLFVGEHWRLEGGGGGGGGERKNKNKAHDFKFGSFTLKEIIKKNKKRVQKVGGRGGGKGLQK